MKDYVALMLGFYWDYVGFYWGDIGIMEKKMETTILGDCCQCRFGIGIRLVRTGVCLPSGFSQACP